MKKIYKLLIVLFITIFVSVFQIGYLNLKFITEALIIAIVVEILAIAGEIRSTYLRNRSPEIIYKTINYLKEWEIKRKISIRYKNEEVKDGFEELISIALFNLNSKDPEVKRAGLAQLHAIESQVSEIERLSIYNGLLNALHNEGDKIFRVLLQESICELFKAYKRFL